MSLSKSKQLFSINSARVKCLDFHPTQPLLLASLYSGEALIVNAFDGVVIKTITVQPPFFPLRTGRWIPFNGNVVFGGDKCSLYFFSPTKGQLLLEIPYAHERTIRSIAVHPTEPKILTCSDDLTCKLWDISNGCQLVKTFDKHEKLVMDIKWNPRDLTTFASCSLDGTYIFWDINNKEPRFSQNASSKPLNSISFAANGDRPLLATSSDDTTVQIWDLQTRSLLATLEGHHNNVSRVDFHPTRPFLVTTSEDKMTGIWSSITFKRENFFNAGLNRGWAQSLSATYPLMAIGFDDGLVIYKFVHNGVPIALNVSTSKIFIAHGSELSTSQIKNVGEIVDGNEIQLNWKDALTTETIPINLLTSPNGRYVATLTDSEYTIYTTLGFRSRAYGKALKFAWAPSSNEYAIVDPNGNIQLFSNFESTHTIDRFCKKIWTGTYLSCSVDYRVEFYDWNSGKIIRRIETHASEISWYNDLVAIRTKDSIYVLQYNQPDEDSTYSQDTGYDDAFTLINTIDVRGSTSIYWHSGVLFYTENCKINRFVGGIVQSTATLKFPIDSILGYLPRENLFVITDLQHNILGVNFPFALIEFESAVAEGNETDAEDIPEQYRTRCAKFLKQIGQKELALALTTDLSMRFDLALELGKLEVGQQAAIEATNLSTNAVDTTIWKRLARAALQSGDIDMAAIALKSCKDFSSLMILYKAKNKRDDMANLVDECEQAGYLNVAFSAALLVGNKKKACELLIKSKKFAEAALFARSNVPEMASECVRLWKESIGNDKVAEALADPAEYHNLFDELLKDSQ